jgi:hypothetical protein
MMVSSLRYRTLADHLTFQMTQRGSEEAKTTKNIKNIRDSRFKVKKTKSPKKHGSDEKDLECLQV